MWGLHHAQIAEAVEKLLGDSLQFGDGADSIGSVEASAAQRAEQPSRSSRISAKISGLGWLM